MMRGRPVRSFAHIAVAIVVAAVVISAAVLSYSSLEATVTHTVSVMPGTSTSTPTVTSTMTATQTITELSTTTAVETQTVVSQTVLSFTTTATETVTSTGYECTISGQAGGIYIRVLSDSSQTPVTGALVIATNQPDYCGTLPATGERTINFTTTASTQWYPLNSGDNGGYSFLVAYSGQTYTFHANLAPVSLTCATLYIPSGKTNVTITEFQDTC